MLCEYYAQHARDLVPCLKWIIEEIEYTTHSLITDRLQYYQIPFP
jgi:hypothetical protein